MGQPPIQSPNSGPARVHAQTGPLFCQPTACAAPGSGALRLRSGTTSERAVPGVQLARPALPLATCERRDKASGSQIVPRTQLKKPPNCPYLRAPTSTPLEAPAPIEDALAARRPRRCSATWSAWPRHKTALKSLKIPDSPILAPPRWRTLFLPRRLTQILPQQENVATMQAPFVRPRN